MLLLMGHYRLGIEPAKRGLEVNSLPIESIIFIKLASVSLLLAYRFCYTVYFELSVRFFLVPDYMGSISYFAKVLCFNFPFFHASMYLSMNFLNGFYFFLPRKVIVFILS